MECAYKHMCTSKQTNTERFKHAVSIMCHESVYHRFLSGWLKSWQSVYIDLYYLFDWRQLKVFLKIQALSSKWTKIFSRRNNTSFGYIGKNSSSRVTFIRITVVLGKSVNWSPSSTWRVLVKGLKAMTILILILWYRDWKLHDNIIFDDFDVC